MSGRRRLALLLLLLLSCWNMFVILPSVVEVLGGDFNPDSSAFFRTTRPYGHMAASPPPELLARPESSAYRRSALDAWRRIHRRRQGQSDAHWAAHILKEVWCESAPAEAAMVPLKTALANRTYLDRLLGTIGCRHACDDARLRSTAGQGEQPTCGEAQLCHCAGGTSYGFDLQAAFDEPSPAFQAAQVMWAADRIQHPAAPQTTASASASAVVSSVASSSSASVVFEVPAPLRDLRRYEFLYAKARQELARAAGHHSMAFASAGAERGVARATCSHLSFDNAFQVSPRAPLVVACKCSPQRHDPAGEPARARGLPSDG